MWNTTINKFVNALNVHLKLEDKIEVGEENGGITSIGYGGRVLKFSKRGGFISCQSRIRD